MWNIQRHPKFVVIGPPITEAQVVTDVKIILNTDNLTPLS
jgi:hypothetical protein